MSDCELFEDQWEHEQNRNSITSDYEKALDRPSIVGGWEYADEDSIQAAMAQTLGGLYCLNPERIYDWAVQYDVNLKEFRETYPNDNDSHNSILLICVLNNWSIETAQETMK